MPTLLTQSEQDLFLTLDKAWLGTVVHQSGKRRLRADGNIPVLPHCRFVQLPEDINVLDSEGRPLKPSPSKRFYISSSTKGPHILLEADVYSIISNPCGGI